VGLPLSPLRRAGALKECIIVGGGLAGGGAATLLAQAGLRPRVFERMPEAHDKVCGEFLSTEAQAHLAALGLDLARLGGVPIHRVRLIAGRRRSEAPLPFTALGLTRRRLDAAVLEHAASCGAQVEYGVTVRSIDNDVVATDAGEVRANTILLATGKHDLRGAKRDSAGIATDLIGFKQYFRVTDTNRAALEGMIEVILFEGGYAGLQLVEGGIANFCLLVANERFAAVGRSWDKLFAELLREPHVAERLGDADAVLPKPLTVSGIPFGFLHAPGDGPANLYRLGDQASVIPSFSGDGMSIALHSGRLAAQAITDDADAHSYHRRLHRDVRRQVRLAHRLQRAGFTGIGQRAILTVMGIWPRALTGVAAATRVPVPALRRAGLAG